MSRSFLFFLPARLPLTPDELGDDTVLRLTGSARIRACLELHLGAIAWDEGGGGSSEADGRWVELTVSDDPALPGLALRCSLRADYADVVQAICDRFGWVAFDESPALYQPHRARMAV